MKLLSRDFTFTERIIMLLLVLVLVGIGYYQFVWKPLAQQIEQAHAERDALQLELGSVQYKLSELWSMQRELDELDEDLGRMESYNNVRAELALLNDILTAAETYSINFSNVTRSGDQVRRNFSMTFTARDYETVRHILTELDHCKYRCVLGDISYSAGYARDGEEQLFSMGFNATFFETMYGGTPDIGLPAA